MKVPFKKVLEAKSALAEISQIDLSIKESVQVSRLLEAVESEAKIFEKERLKLCEKYGEPDKDNNLYKIKPEFVSKFEAEFAELLELEADIPGEQIKITSKDFSIKPSVILAVKAFIIFEGDD